MIVNKTDNFIYWIGNMNRSINILLLNDENQN